jgi:hypothetical protein
MKNTLDMAREAGFDVVVQINAVDGSTAHLKTLVELARADEREACAKVCDELAEMLVCHNDRGGAEICVSLRDTIRARGETK